MESEVSIAKRRVQEWGLDYRSKNGDGVIHYCADANPPMVHACSNLGQNINLQNFDGDTALHLAVRKGNVEVVNSLLMCGADTSTRNKLGQTPVDMARCETISCLLQAYKPGLVQAVTKGDYVHLLKMVNRLSVNLNSIIKEDKSALMIARERTKKDANYAKCYCMLKDKEIYTSLFHSVLEDDHSTLLQILNNTPEINVNKRYKERHGWTPVTYAVAWRCYDVTKVLIETGRCNLNIRVADQILGCTTEPLYFKTLNEECPVEIWRLVRDNMDPGQDSERDVNGNTGIFRALQCGRSAEFIEELINWKNGCCIKERNSSGQTARDVAAETERHDVVEVIDNYICDHLNGEFLVQLPVLFYERENLAIKSRDGIDLQTLIMKAGNENDAQALINYEAIQDYGIALFKAVQEGDLKGVAKFNKSHYTDRNGFTAMTRAVVFQQLRAAEILLTERPELKAIPDNSNRYPLHYAYALPSGVSEQFIGLLLKQDADDLEHRVDKDGRLPVDYRDIKDTEEIQQILNDVKTLDPFGNRQICEDNTDESECMKPDNCTSVGNRQICEDNTDESECMKPDNCTSVGNRQICEDNTDERDCIKPDNCTSPETPILKCTAEEDDETEEIPPMEC